jgi:hypothetical protein
MGRGGGPADGLQADPLTPIASGRKANARMPHSSRLLVHDGPGVRFLLRSLNPTLTSAQHGMFGLPSICTLKAVHAYWQGSPPANGTCRLRTLTYLRAHARSYRHFLRVGGQERVPGRGGRARGRGSRAPPCGAGDWAGHAAARGAAGVRRESQSVHMISDACSVATPGAPGLSSTCAPRSRRPSRRAPEVCLHQSPPRGVTGHRQTRRRQRARSFPRDSSCSWLGGDKVVDNVSAQKTSKFIHRIAIVVYPGYPASPPIFKLPHMILTI